MMEEDSEEVRTYHTCQRRDCTRVFRDFDGYTDLIPGGFDSSRGSLRTCPKCGAVLYLAEVDRSQKIETWECPQKECDYSEESRSPSSR
jgi:ssDNA-binding Zn-finger/Zn-ribbon topoisomerase 1